MSWRRALSKCREFVAELFEPADDTEMRWIGIKLRTINGSGFNSMWHVYGHSDLFGKHAWHSGRPLNGSFGTHLVSRHTSKLPKCNNSRSLMNLSTECSILQLNNLKQLELTIGYVPCVRVKFRFICRRELRATSQSVTNFAQEKLVKQVEWISHSNNDSFEYNISNSVQNWYQALHECHAIGGDLPIIESTEEANWVRDKVLSQAAPEEATQINYSGFFVKLHKWAYNSSGWA